MQQVTITFPELRFRQSAGNKIRGYFANWWGEKSNLLHNHEKDGKPIYRYPLVQYKVLRRTPTIIGLNDGAKLLLDMFLNLKELVIEEEVYQLANKNLKSREVAIGLSEEMHTYQFLSLWMGLNPKRYQEWKKAGEEERRRIEEGALRNNIFAFFKSMGVWLEGRVKVELDAKPTPTNFKSQRMTAFKGTFRANVLLPDLIGLGKSTARGYGTIQKI